MGMEGLEPAGSHAVPPRSVTFRQWTHS